LGSCHVEAPYIVAGQIATAYYFAHFLIIIPVFGIIDNVLSMIAISSHGLIHEEAKVEKIKVEEGEMTEEKKTKAKEEEELNEFLYSVQNLTFNHIR
jgi:hypothetical protein